MFDSQLTHRKCQDCRGDAPPPRHATRFEQQAALRRACEVILAARAARPRLLDLYCGAGGAAAGYHQAGFDVTGVDIAPQPRFPYPFIRADALTFPLDGFDVIHASPPCQRYAHVTRWRGSQDNHPDLLQATIGRLAASGIPWIVENVPEALPAALLQLCGTHFGLPVKRHRRFLVPRPVPPLPPCRSHHVQPFQHEDERAYADAMGCTWMTGLEAREAIPPAYTRYIGRQLIAGNLVVLLRTIGVCTAAAAMTRSCSVT